MKGKYIKIYIDIPIEKVLQKYAVKALKDNHVRAFSRKLAETARKKTFHEKSFWFNVFQKQAQTEKIKRNQYLAYKLCTAYMGSF